MQPKNSKIFTYQTRIKTDEEELLVSFATLLSQVERHLFKAYLKGISLTGKNLTGESLTGASLTGASLTGASLLTLKSEYLKRFNITARQYNSCRIELEGKISSYKELLTQRILLLQEKIKKLQKHIVKIKDPFKKHQKQRRLFQLKSKLKRLETDQKENKIRLCFGGKEFFKKQHFLKENGFKNHQEWKKEWDKRRNRALFLVGSKDETSGNQSAQLIWQNGSFSLKLRLPNGFTKKTILIKDFQFAYGQEEILNVLAENEKRKNLQKNKLPYTHAGKAIGIRLLKDDKGWRLFVSIEKEKPDLKTNQALGTIGIDINANHIALAETDRFGNFLEKQKIPCNCYGKNKNQRAAIIGDVAKVIIEKALKVHKPIVLEELNFQKKKQALRELNKKLSRLLSSLAYKQILTFIESKAFRAGVEVLKINPAYTSIIGKVKFKERYGLSVHESAALVIARRPKAFSEKPPSHIKFSDKNFKSAFIPPVWDGKKHVFSFYGELLGKLKAAHAVHQSTRNRSSKPQKL